MFKEVCLRHGKDSSSIARIYQEFLSIIEINDKIVHMAKFTRFVLTNHKDIDFILTIHSNKIEVPMPTEFRKEQMEKPTEFRKESMEKTTKRDRVWMQTFGEHISGLCSICRISVINKDMINWHMGHIVSRANGGSPEEDNLRAICVTCNMRMGMMNMDDYCKIKNLQDAVEELNLSTPPSELLLDKEHLALYYIAKLASQKGTLFKFTYKNITTIQLNDAIGLVKSPNRKEQLATLTKKPNLTFNDVESLYNDIIKNRIANTSGKTFNEMIKGLQITDPPSIDIDSD